MAKAKAPVHLDVDRVRSQISPRAIEILEAHGVAVLPGRALPAAGSYPNFRGVDEAWWKAFAQRDESAFHELYGILQTDFPTYCALLLTVFNKSAGFSHPFIFNNGQAIAWDRMADALSKDETLFFLFLKARQLGVSTLVVAFHHWHAWRTRDMNTMMIAHEDKLAKKFVALLGMYHDHLPDLAGMKPTLREKRKDARIPKSELFYSDRRSSIMTHVAKNVEARGQSSKHILLSEFAFYPEPEALLDALMPQLPPFGSPARKECSVIIESTPNGQNTFYTLWKAAKKNDSEWHACFLPWMVQDDMYYVEPPDHFRLSAEESALMKQLSNERKKIDGKGVSRGQMYWRRHVINNEYDGNPDAFDMEYPSDDESCFLSYKSESVFRNQIKLLQTQCAEAEIRAEKVLPKFGFPALNFLQCDMKFSKLRSPLESRAYEKPNRALIIPTRNGLLTIWDPPREGHYYTIGGDSAGGIYERDLAVASVLDVTTGRQVAELASPLDPERFADQFANLGMLYNNALLMPEINGNGAVVLKRVMQDWNYPNVAREEKWDEVGLKKHKYGFSTQENTKPILVSNMVWMLQEGFVSISSRDLLSELTTFKQDGYTFRDNPMYKASGRNHDDRVMAWALACVAVKQSPKLLSLVSQNAHNIPTAVELGLNRAPQMPDNKKLPKALQNIFDGQESWVMPSNPIRGMF